MIQCYNTETKYLDGRKLKSVFTEYITLGLLVFILLATPSVHAQNYKLGINELKFTCTINNAVPSLSATYNISIDYANGTTFLSNSKATAQGQGLFNYTIEFNETGVYNVHQFCYDGVYSYSDTEPIIVNLNGNDAPSGIVVSLFTILFLIVLGLICVEAIYSIGHLLNLDFDLIDFALNFGAYVVIVAFSYLQNYYVGNSLMKSILDGLVTWGWLLFILIPTIALILSLSMGSLNKKKLAIAPPIQKRRIPFYKV